MLANQPELPVHAASRVQHCLCYKHICIHSILEVCRGLIETGLDCLIVCVKLFSSGISTLHSVCICLALY